MELVLSHPTIVRDDRGIARWCLIGTIYFAFYVLIGAHALGLSLYRILWEGVYEWERYNSVVSGIVGLVLRISVAVLFLLAFTAIRREKLNGIVLAKVASVAAIIEWLVMFMWWVITMQFKERWIEILTGGTWLDVFIPMVLTPILSAISAISVPLGVLAKIYGYPKYVVAVARGFLIVAILGAVWGIVMRFIYAPYVLGVGGG